MFKAPTEFYASQRHVCKSCVIARVAKHREANIERIREYDRQRGYHGKPGYAAEYQSKYPERRAAQVQLGNAVRDGRVIPWPVCAVPECGERPEAHHPNYDAPLDVVWLCPVHHKQTHAMARHMNRLAA